MAPVLLNPYRYAAAATFKPSNLSKVKAWYSADYEATQGWTDGQVMTTVTDLSGNGNHMTLTGGPTGPKFRSAGGPSGGPSFQFPGGSAGYYTLPNIFGSSGTPSYNITNNAAELYAQLISEHDGTDPYPGTWTFGTLAGDPVHYPFSPTSATEVYEKFGLPGGNRANGAATTSLTAWHRLNIEVGLVANGGWKIRWNDVASSGWQNYNSHGSVKIYDAPLVGINGPGGQRARCRMGVLILANDKFTTGERADIAAYSIANPSGGTP